MIRKTTKTYDDCPPMSKLPVETILSRFVDELLELQPTPPLIPFNHDWPSLCYLQQAENGQLVGWRPSRQLPPSDMFTRLQDALQEDIHPDIVSFYTSFWSDPLPAICEHGELSLIQVWNDEDMERLRSNLIGHALSKRQQKRPLTFFFACPEPDENYFISLDNFSGEIWLETPGKPPIRKLADSMSEFLQSLSPLKVTDAE
ncbi:MAG: SecY interacting protein Syd [Neptuniibacter caesariensis]|uniref:SecY interacting protein Syd n=1 Tax=Neptuniibacter caesariensis TaxID=207954 RepID=A0A2G6JQS7_NEPCE|nr:MAG: SecY interacting protein Syd [Neptuniibacter caesariensis]